MTAKMGRPPKDGGYTESKSFRFSKEQIDKLEAEARKRRMETGDLVYPVDILRELIDAHLPELMDEDEVPIAA